MEDVRASALDASDSTWRDVAVRRSRLGALLADGGQLLRVSVEGGRLDYVNLGSAVLTHVQFLDCWIGELDLGAARLTSARFRSCRIGRLVLNAATLQAVDLRGTDLSSVEGVDRMSGAVLTPEQLVQLAPAFAETMGITISALD